MSDSTQAPSKARIGFIGLGTMGMPMVSRLLASHYEVVVSRTSGSAAEAKRNGAMVVETRADVARLGDVVFLALPNSAAVESVMLGSQGVADAIRPGSIVIDVGTSDPESTRELATLLEAKECQLVDAPVSGGEPAAVAGSLSCMVGGQEMAYERAKPILATLATTIRYIGPSGMGHTMKLVNNMVGLGNLTVLCEALSVGRQLGIDIGTACEVIAAGSGDSKALDFWGKRLIEENYREPTYRFALAVKDMRLANRVTAASRLPCPVLSATQLVFATAASLGSDGEDVCVIKSLWDRLIELSSQETVRSG